MIQRYNTIQKYNHSTDKKVSGRKSGKRIAAEVLALTQIAMLTYGVNGYAASANTMMQITENGIFVASEMGNVQNAADVEADLEEYMTGAGVELIIGSIDSMTREDFEDMMENLTIMDQEEEDSNWGYENLGIANVTENLNIRKGPSTNDEKVGELPADAACEVLGISNGWAHILSGDVEGYVSMEYLLTGDEAKERALECQTLTATVLAQTLKVRKQPDTEHGTWGLIGNGKKLEVVEVLDNGWVSVVYGDGKDAAYVSGDYVEVAYSLETALTMTEVRYGKGVTDAGVDLASRAIQYVGNPYVYGGTSLTNGTDCSGFTMLLMQKYGISLSHSARAQSKMGTAVSISELRPGDLVFYADGSGINHVAIYIGGGQVCHASNPTRGIIISSLYYRNPVCARRLL
ncbi:MAG: NlpC/P60 family protein [Lachnospiraceae bacterium]